jgi:hypothetical protein
MPGKHQSMEANFHATGEWKPATTLSGRMHAWQACGNVRPSDRVLCQGLRKAYGRLMIAGSCMPPGKAQ